jgi:hypothetical protein
MLKTRAPRRELVSPKPCHPTLNGGSLPLVTLSLEARRTRERKHQLADAVYEALRAAIHFPENDRSLAIREHAAGDLIADSDYLGVARSGHRVFLEITLRRGRATEKKQALYSVFTNPKSDQQPRGAAFLDGKAASDFVPAPIPL